MSSFAYAVADTAVIARRNLLRIPRQPDLLISFTVQPVIFVLLFVYVFGGAVENTFGIPYVDYLIPGIFVQMSVFGAMGTAVGLAADVKSGLLERFQALPMARSAVLAGRTTADVVRNVFVMTLVSGVGFLVGFRVQTDALGYLAGVVLVLLFGYSLSWVFATVGLAVKDPETAQAAAFPIMAPLVFASSVFVPVASMPSWLQPFAEHQPVSVVASAARSLMSGTPSDNYVLQALAWIVGIVAVAAPIAVRRYRRVF
jgi:ABC transporter DrrB family efflux protein